MTRCTLMLVLAATLGLWPAYHAEAALNNGFETDWVYTIRTTGEIRAFSEFDGSAQIPSLVVGTSMNGGSLTFAGTGSSDARLFVARTNNAAFGGTDVSLFEIDSAGTIVNSTTIETILSDSSAVTFCDTPTIRYSAFHNTLFVAINPEDGDLTTTPAMIYEIDLGLSTRIHTYVGPIVGRRKVHVDINSRNGTLYVTNRNMANNPGPVNTQGDLIAFSTAGRLVGGTTTAFTTLVNGATFQAGDPRWTEPEAAIYRRKANAADDTIVVLMSGGGAIPSLELYLDTTAHPVDGNGNLALVGASISAARAFAGQQDDVTGHIWLGALNGGFHVLRADNTTQGFFAGNFLDADSPFSPAPVPPSIAEVTPDPQIVGTGSEYSIQLSLLQGTPPVTWSVVQGPPGTQVSGTGLVSGWTPGPADAGNSFTFEIRAQNAQGLDTETWQVQVSAANNGFILDYLYSTRADAAQLKIHRKVDGVEVANLVTNTAWTTLTFSGVGQTDDARLFVAQPTPGNNDVQIAELNSNGQTVHSALLSTIIGGPVGPVITLSNIRYSSFHNTLFVGLNPDNTGVSNGTAYEIDLGLSTRIHTYVGGVMSTTIRGAGVDINARDGTLYMTGQHLGEASETGFGDVIAFNTAGRTLGGTTSAFTVVIDGPTQNASNILYSQPSCPIYRKRPSGDDTLIVLTNASASSSPVLEYYLNTVAHPVDPNGNLAYRGNPLGIPRGWNGQQDIGTLNVWMAGLRGGIHALRDDDTVGSFDTGRWWSDTDAPPFRSCNEPFADADGDTDVDHDDFSVFQLCYTGPSGGVPVGCACFDRQRDGDVDNFDFNAFSNCRTGPNVPWTQVLAPNCSP